MAKFCGKCGSELDEIMGLCPNCEEERRKEHAEILEEEKTSGRNRRRGFFKLVLGLLILISLGAGVIGGLTYFNIVKIPAVTDLMETMGIKQESSVSELCKDYAKAYEVIAENKDGTVKIEVVVPDFENILKEEMNDGSTEKLNLDSLVDAIDKYPALEKKYILTVKDTNQASIEEAILQQVFYDLMVSAIMETEITDYQEAIE